MLGCPTVQMLNITQHSRQISHYSEQKRKLAHSHPGLPDFTSLAKQCGLCHLKQPFPFPGFIMELVQTSQVLLCMFLKDWELAIDKHEQATLKELRKRLRLSTLKRPHNMSPRPFVGRLKSPQFRLQDAIASCQDLQCSIQLARHLGAVTDPWDTNTMSCQVFSGDLNPPQLWNWIP